ncbi:SdrD B-like domain-containing protein, partial [Staphylococcus borealis]|uniref:SdrD B-like domain-containing protein n=1 Tax=Staphylococcus borealis TaxID=2742203 RepID=UPI002DB5DD1B
TESTNKESEGTVTEQPTTESTNKESEGTVTEQPTTESTNKESEGAVTEQPTTESTNKESEGTVTEQPTAEGTNKESEGTVTEQSTTERVDDYKDINQSLSETEKKLKQTSNDQEKAQVLAEFLSKNTDASFEEATDKANSLNIDFNDVNSNTLLNALINEQSHKDDFETNYATTNDINNARMMQPSTRFKVNTFAALGGGTNVNDLITVFNQSIEEGVNIDGTISAHDGEPIIYHTDVHLDDAIKSGDKMTVDYDPHTIPSDLTNDYSVPDMLDSSGNTVATGEYDDTNKQATYTFTDYVDTHSNINGSLSLVAFIDKSTVPERDTNVDVTFKTANNAFDKNFTVAYQYPFVQGDSNIQSLFTNLDLQNKTVEQTVYVNPLRYNANNTRVIIDGNTPNGNTLVDDTTNIKIYKVGSEQFLPDSNKIYDYSEYEDVTNLYPVEINGDNTASINFGNINTPYIIKVNSKYESNNENVTTNVSQIVKMITDDYYNNRANTAQYGNGITVASGNAEANGTLHSLGDYVWEDTNRDGIQDSEEKGIQDVTVTLKDGNGNVIGTTTTDENGKYQFNDLENGSYEVSFTTPEGYTPTKSNTGDNDANDSDGLTTVGIIKDEDNWTLDSGFYKTPKYNLGDYVWKDTNRDGIQDSEEKGIQDVTVTLKDGNGNVIGTTTTDENGKY